jgi:hypothetical protein
MRTRVLMHVHISVFFRRVEGLGRSQVNRSRKCAEQDVTETKPGQLQAAEGYEPQTS